MIVIGLTGGIGSGKTSVLQLFINKGIPVYIADIEAKRLMQSDKELIKKIKTIFGNESYTKDNQLNRAYLANQVFGDNKKLEQLNAIVHPAVHRDLEAFKKQQKSKFFIYENAILFENESYKYCDYIITVTAPIETRIKRVVKRDQVTKKQVKDRMQHQWDEQLKIQKSDFVIENINWETTEKLVDKLYQKLLDLSTN
ncbi:MAG TPA: dephospho-CoA kinase [Lutibacter sp.]|nr:dephospho-CoA kinase [Lutibacter sp.]